MSGNSGNKVILKIKPRNNINMQVLPPSLSLTDVERAENAANIAMAWAQKDESPNGENDTDSPTGKTQSSKSWALNAKNDALSAAASASAVATSETNAANSEDKAQAWAESETSPDGEPDSKSAKTWAGESSDSAELAQKWAESDESPDGETDTDSPTGDTMSSKEWALYAKQLAQQIGNPVVSVTESNGTVTVAKSDGAQNTFGVVKSVNGVTPTGGNVNITGVPTGTILPFAGNTIPEGFLACEGAGLSTETYSELYAVIGNTYGGDTTTFNLPNITGFVELPLSGQAQLRYTPSGKYFGIINANNNSVSAMASTDGDTWLHPGGGMSSNYFVPYVDLSTVSNKSTPLKYIIKY